jgi:hypothetical protein
MPHADAQRSELGIFLGGARYNGDLHPEWLNLKFLGPAVGVLYRYHLNYHWSLKGNVYYGKISADDAASKDSFQLNRNLNFKSGILDISLQAEFNFFPFDLGNSEQFITPYAFTGISLFKWNPKGEFSGQWYELQPLGTEGQGTTVYNKKEYSLTQVAIPMGVGLKMDLGKLCLGIEAGARRAFTDYIDDVSTVYPDKIVLAAEHGPVSAVLSDKSLAKEYSIINRQRGNSRTKDWYTFIGITLSFRLGKKTSLGCGRAL